MSLAGTAVEQEAGKQLAEEMKRIAFARMSPAEVLYFIDLEYKQKMEENQHD
ncbi:MAG: hypothetical protein J0H71_18005 [Rhizobiales bacterium]|nr:hypothetical protein [Hyphomicrobiales bacterium]